MNLTTLGWVLVGTGLVGFAALGLAELIRRRDRRADRTIRAHIDAALLGGPDWADDEQACADCLDCAADHRQPSEVEILARYESELDHRRINAIVRAYGAQRRPR